MICNLVKKLIPETVQHEGGLNERNRTESW